MIQKHFKTEWILFFLLAYDGFCNTKCPMTIFLAESDENNHQVLKVIRSNHW